MCWLLVLTGLLFVVATSKLAYDSATKERVDKAGDPSWFVFLAVTSFVAWLFGVVLGDINYFYNTEPYYDLRNLNNYREIDPSRSPGQQFMDAGRISFTSGTRLDVEKAMAFRNVDIYCVAPIINNQSGSYGNASLYDFWAVGLNCCNGKPGYFSEFSCGEFSNPRALSGLRVMRESHRTFYRLAVEQAQAAFSLNARHPIFLYWVQDPQSELAAYLDEGWRYYLFGISSAFCVMLSLVLIAVVCFAKREFS